MRNFNDFEKSRLYKSVKEKAALEYVPRWLKKGLNIEDVAEALELDIEFVRKAAEQK